MSVLLAWIAAPFRRVGGTLVAWGLLIGALILALAGFKRKSERKGRREEREKNERVQLRQALKEGKKHAKITNAMHEANVDGPHSADDVLERMRNAEDD